MFLVFGRRVRLVIVGLIALPVLTVSAVVGQTSAQGAPSDCFTTGTLSATPPSGVTKPTGSGTSGDPYLVGSKANLLWMSWAMSEEDNNDSSERLSDARGAVYKQTANIDLASCNFMPIAKGTQNAPNPLQDFQGEFDGAGYTISGLLIEAPADVETGLFGRLDGATVKNVSISSASVTADDEPVGVLAGVATNSSVVQNISVSGTVSNGAFSGGLIGHASSVAISNSSAAVAVYSQKNGNGGLVGFLGSGASVSNSYATGALMTPDEDRVGGLVGDSEGTITNSYATGDIQGADDVGGLVGEANGDITGSYATGDVTSTGDNSGGLVGELRNSANIEESYATGKVLGVDDSGGLVGQIQSNSSILYSYASGDLTATDEDAGGLVGNVGGSPVTISNSYASGDVTGTTDVGGLVGDVGPNSTNGLTVTNSYAVGTTSGSSNTEALFGNLQPETLTATFWDSTTSGTSSATTGGSSKTTAQMQSIATFTTDLGGSAWALVSATAFGDPTGPTTQVWGIGSGLNCGYPFLWWQTQSGVSCPSPGNSGGSDDDDDEEQTVPATAPTTPGPPAVPSRAPAATPPAPTRVTGPVLTSGRIPEPPASPRVRIGGELRAVTQSAVDPETLVVETDTVSVSLRVARSTGAVREEEDGLVDVVVKNGSEARFAGTGLQPGATVQVFIPLTSDDARELAQLTVGPDGTFAGDAPFSADPLADPLPIGQRLVQLVSVDAEGNQVVVDMAVTIEQPDPAPAINREEGVVPTVEPGNAVVMSAGKPTEATITGVEDQKLVVVEGDGWDMAINLSAPDAVVEQTESGARLTLIRNESAQVSGTGFLAGTRADVWLFSEPTLLGTVTIDDNGEFTGEVDIDPDLIPTGEHTLQLQGVGQDGYVKAASLGVVVDDAAVQTVAQTAESPVMVAWWIVAAVIVFVLLLIVLLVARRRRYSV